MTFVIPPLPNVEIALAIPVFTSAISKASAPIPRIYGLRGEGDGNLQAAVAMEFALGEIAQIFTLAEGRS